MKQPRQIERCQQDRSKQGVEARRHLERAGTGEAKSIAPESARKESLREVHRKNHPAAVPDRGMDDHPAHLDRTECVEETRDDPGRRHPRPLLDQQVHRKSREEPDQQGRSVVRDGGVRSEKRSGYREQPHRDHRDAVSQGLFCGMAVRRIEELERFARQREGVMSLEPYLEDDIAVKKGLRPSVNPDDPKPLFSTF